MSHSILAIIQARMSSSRLPGKVLQDITGKPILLHMSERVRQAKLVDDLVIATSTDPTDDILALYCHDHDLPCFRGHLSDVLDRVYQAASQFHAEVIIRLTADCPLIDPELIDLTTSVFLGNPIFPQLASPPQFSAGEMQGVFPYHFVADRLPPPWKRTLPIGLDVEVCSFDVLQQAWSQADQPYQREHVLPYLYEGVSFPPGDPPPGFTWYLEQARSSRGFRVALLNHVPDYGSLRWTVDTPADLEFVRQVFAHFEGQPGFTWKDILSLLEREPALAQINAGTPHKSAFDVDQRRIQS